MPDDAAAPPQGLTETPPTQAAEGVVLPAAPLPAPCGSGSLHGGAYAALDLGTNNCRLLVGAPTGGGFRVVDSFSRIVRLGEGLAATGRLSEAAMDRALAALSACADKLARRPLRGFRAVATEACRRAPQRGAIHTPGEAGNRHHPPQNKRKKKKSFKKSLY